MPAESSPERPDDLHDVRRRIVRAATELLALGGREAVSTRAVSSAAGVQAPTLYRHFGDMQGLLDAVAGDLLADYVSQKRVFERSDDPVEDLRRGWDHHVAFGVANPSAYLLIFSDASRLSDSPARREGETILRDLVGRVAETGRLAVAVPHAARMMAAACRGVVLSLIATPQAERDAMLSEHTREAVMSAITVAPACGQSAAHQAHGGRVAARAVALRAVLHEAPNVLSASEEALLGEWLDRLSAKRSHRAV